MMQKSLLNYVLQQADNTLILGHRLSEWCGHGPILEQDIALTNIALDHIGQARSLYQYAAEVYNALPAESKSSVFNSYAFSNITHPTTEDELAYLRDGWDFKNALLVEQPNIDWAYTIARSFFYDHFSVIFYRNLQDSKDEIIAGIAQKSLKEALYHKRWSSEWIIRLGDGTEESHLRIQKAIDERWSYTGELFMMSEADKVMLEQNIGINLEQAQEEWLAGIHEILHESTIGSPSDQAWMQKGGKEGVHSEQLGFILAEMQHMQRTYPGMEW